MIKHFNLKVDIGDLRFDVKYKSQQDKQNDPLGTINVIEEIMLNGYVLSLGQFRETEAYNSISAMVKQDSFDKWDIEWKNFNSRNKK